MTAAAQQRIMNKLQLVPDDKEPLILNFIATFEQPIRTDIADSGLDVGPEFTDENHDERMERAFALAKNIEIDEQAIRDLREVSMI